MPYNPAIHHRRSIRLTGYDYSQPGAYFITLCTHRRQALFGQVVDGEMRLNEFGAMVEWTWHDLVNHVAGIELGEFVVMPNHIHGIVIIVDAPTSPVGAGSKPARVSPAPASPDDNGMRAGLEPAPASPDDNGKRAGLEPAPTISAPASMDPDPSAVRAGSKPAPAPLSEIVRQLKTFSARAINQRRGTPGVEVWQRDYWEHIIRDERAYQQIAAYILHNPACWQADQLHPTHPDGAHE